MPEDKPVIPQRKLGLFSLSNIVVANMIGAGIFTTSGLLMGDLGNPLIMLILWGIGGLIALSGAISYGELGATYPKSGGEYTYLSKIYNPMTGFVSGWVSFLVGFSAPIAASAIGFSEYLARAFPAAFYWGTLSDISKPAISIFIILIFSLIHLKGIDYSAKVQNWLTLLKILLVAGLIFAGFIFGKGNFNHITQSNSFSFNFQGWKSMGLSIMWIMFAYSGWNASSYIGSEIKNPSINLPRSLLLGTGIVTILYLLINVFFVYATNPEEMKGVISIGGLAVEKAFGNKYETLFSLLISFALFSSLSAFLILGPRVYHTMSADGYFFKSIGKLNPVTNVPSKAIILQATISIIMVLSGTFDQILTFMGFSLSIFPLLAVFGIFIIRKKQMSKIKLPGYPYVQIFYLVMGISILFLSLFERPVESIIAILTALTGIPVFYLFKKIK